MRWSIDLRSRSLYITLSDAPSASQREMADGTVVDVDESGHVVGIEVLRFDAPWDPNLVTASFDLSPEARDSIAWLISVLPAVRAFPAPCERTTEKRASPTAEFAFA